MKLFLPALAIALTMTAAAASCRANDFIRAPQDYRNADGSLDHAAYAAMYAKSCQELRDGKLIGVAYSTGTFQAVAGRTPILTAEQRRCFSDDTSNNGGGRPAIGP